MRYQPFDPSLFVRHRERFAATLGPGTLAVLVASDQVPSNGGTYHPYKPDSNLFWLTLS